MLTPIQIALLAIFGVFIAQSLRSKDTESEQKLVEIPEEPFPDWRVHEIAEGGGIVDGYDLADLEKRIDTPPLIPRLYDKFENWMQVL